MILLYKIKEENPRVLIYLTRDKFICYNLDLFQFKFSYIHQPWRRSIRDCINLKEALLGRPKCLPQDLDGERMVEFGARQLPSLAWFLSGLLLGFYADGLLDIKNLSTSYVNFN